MSVSGDSYSDTPSKGGPPSRNSADSSRVDGDHSQDILEQDQSLKSAAFGVAYTLSQVKLDAEIHMGLLRLVLDYLQLLLVMLHFNHHWEFRQNGAYNLLRWVLFTNPVVDKGYSFLIAVVYVGVAIVVWSCLVFLWIGWCFKRDSKMAPWVVRLLRLAVSTCCQYFFPSTFCLFLLTLNCRPFSSDPAVVGHLLEFPAVGCLQLPHLVHAATAAVVAVVLLLVSLLISITDADTSPVTPRLFGCASSYVETFNTLAKAGVVIFATLVNDAPKWRALGLLACTVLMTWQFYVQAPCYIHWVNHIRVGLHSSLMWVALILTIWAFERTGFSAHTATLAFYVGLGPAIGAGFLASYIKYARFTRNIVSVFRASIVENKIKNIYTFASPLEVDLAHRCFMFNRHNGDFDDESVKLGEAILKVGLVQFPKDPLLYILNCNFLIDVKGNYQSGQSQLQAAKRLHPDIWLQFVIFIREQEHRRLARSQERGKETTTDLASYVEFQKSYRLLMRRHHAALGAIKEFWRVLLHSEIKFTSLLHAFKHMEKMADKTQRTYQMVLERYPAEVKLLRSYAMFTEEVLNDPWSASKLYSEADHLEEVEADANQSDEGFEDEGTEALTSHVNEKKNAVIVINASGSIQIANKVALQLFGYKKGELDGKNVSILMPPPYSHRHSLYLRNCVAQGKEKSAVIGQVRPMVALHKQKYVIPIRLGVSKVSGSGADSVFMGVIAKEEEDPGVVRAWILPTGALVCVDQLFFDWFGVQPSECVGVQLTALAAPEEHQRLTEYLKAAPEAETGASCVFHMQHKFLESVKVEMKCTLGGSETQPLLTLEFTRVASETKSVLVMDSNARIMFASVEAAAILGYAPEQLMTMDATQLMPAPFNTLHSSWIKDATGRSPPNSCRSGMVVMAQASNNLLAPIKMQFTTRELNDATYYIVRVEKATVDEGLQQRYLELHCDMNGNVTAVNQSYITAFGFKPASLVGTNLSSFVNIFAEVQKADGEASVARLLQGMAIKSVESRSISWRVGVQPPKHGKATQQTSHRAASKSAAKAAVLQIEVPTSSDAVGEECQYIVKLFRADFLTATMEVDMSGAISKAATCTLYKPGLVFGTSTTSISRQTLAQILDLGPLGIDALVEDQQRRGNLKTSAQGARNIPSKRLPGRHTDGQPLTLLVESSYKDASMRRIVIKLSIVKPVCGSLEVVKRTLGALYIPPAAAAAESDTSSIVPPASPVLSAELSSSSLRGSTSGRHLGPPASTRQLGRPSVSFADRGAGAFTLDVRSSVSNVDSVPERRSLGPLAEYSGPPAGDAALPHYSTYLKEGQAARPPGQEGDAGESGSFKEEDRMQRARDLVAVAWCGVGAQKVAEEDLPYERKNSDPFVGAELEDNASSVVDEEEDPAVLEEDSQPTWQSDFKRGKRARKLAKLMQKRQAQEPLQTFASRIKLLIFILLAVHVTSFVVFNTELSNLYEYIADVATATRVVDEHTIASLGSQLLRELDLNRSAPSLYTSADVPYWVNLMREKTDSCQGQHYRVYLGTEKLRRLRNNANIALKNLFEASNLTAIYMADTREPVLQPINVTLWDMVNDWASSAREVYSNHLEFAAQSDIKRNRHWQMLKQNVPWNIFTPYLAAMDGLVYRTMEQIFQTNKLVMGLLVSEGIVVMAIAVVYIFALLGRVAGHRYSLYSVFLMVPSGYVRALATKNTHVDIDDDDDDDDDRDLAVVGATAGPPANDKSKRQGEEAAGATKKILARVGSVMSYFPHGVVSLADEDTVLRKLARKLRAVNHALFGDSGPIVINKKSLIQDGKDTYRLLAPFICWAILVCSIYGNSYNHLQHMEQPIINVLLAGHVRYRISRTMYFAHEVTVGESLAEKGVSKTSMMKVHGRLLSAYNALLYGSGPTRDTLWGSKGSLFASSLQGAHRFFELKGRCFRHDAENCLKPGHPLYQVTHNGLDAMMRRFCSEVYLLNKDNSTEVSTNSTRLRTIWHLGRYDLHHGFMDVSDQFLTSATASFKRVLSMHIILFAISWIITFLYLLLVYKPFLRHGDGEVKSIAKMLSQMPPDMDVESLVEQVLLINASPATTAKPEPADLASPSLKVKSDRLPHSASPMGWLRAANRKGDAAGDAACDV